MNQTRRVQYSPSSSTDQFAGSKQLELVARCLNMVPAMDAPFGPDGLPAVFDGGAWCSHDRRFWWNGAAWVPATKSAGGSWLVKIGIILMLLALLGYAIYTTIATKSEFTIAYSIGVVIFFAILVAIYRFAGRWGWFGILIRAGCFVLALLKVLTLIAHPPPG